MQLIFFWMITKIKLDIYAIMIYHSANFEWNQCIPSKCIDGKNNFTLYFTPTTKTKSKNGHNLAEILRMITNIEPALHFTMIYSSANFQLNQCIPAKVIERIPVSTHQHKLSRKRAIIRPKFCGWLLISYLTCTLQWYILLQTFNTINASLPKIIDRKSISTPTKTKSRKGHKSAIFGGWLPISNDLYFTVM